MGAEIHLDPHCDLVVLCQFCVVLRWSYVDVVDVDRFRGRLLDFTADVFASLTRAGWRERGECYLRGLMQDGKRKSVQPMAARLPEVHEQALNHFLTDSPWDPVPVRDRLAHLMDAAIDPEAWVLDDTGFLKSGD